MRLLVLFGRTLAFAVLCSLASAEPAALRVMSFNIWVGGEGGRRPLEETAAVIRAARADVVGIQEGYGRERFGVKPNRSKELAALLGWHYADQGDGGAIMSPHEIVGLTPEREGAELRLPDGATFYLFNVHLNHAPYQPYQLLKIDYADAPFLDTPEQLVEAAEAARGAEIRRALREIEPLLAQEALVVLTGDFNEPSHLDWTPRAAEAGVVPAVVAYPTSRAVLAAGLVDTFRTAHPDEVARPGWTWTPTTAPDDPKDRHDRIDFVYASPGWTVVSSEIVGEAAPAADIVVERYPSDHRAVVTELRWPAR